MTFEHKQINTNTTTLEDTRNIR